MQLLRVGSSGSQVVQLQRELQAAGIDPGGIDGVFGPRTRAAVVAYQQRFHLGVDGVVGNQTWHALQTDAFTPGSSPSPVSVPPTGGPSSSKVDRLLAEARSHLGYHEGAGNSNPFSAALGRPPESWCADFVSYCALKAGFNVNTCNAQQVANTLAARGLWKGRSNPQPGDAITFRWDGTHRTPADHVGLVERVFVQNGQTWVQTIEGNASDSVKRNVYLASSAVINGFGRLG